MTTLGVALGVVVSVALGVAIRVAMVTGRPSMAVNRVARGLFMVIRLGG